MLTILIPEFFNAFDQVVENVQEDTYEEEEDDTEAMSAGEKEEGDEKKQQEQPSDSSNAESESLGLDQQDVSGQDVNQEDEVRPQVEVTEEVYNPGKPAQYADEGNLLNFYLADFFRAEYLSILDSTYPHLATHTTEPSVDV